VVVGNGHAWITMKMDGKNYLVEPLAGKFLKYLPRLSMIRYEPETSVEWDGEKIYYFKHERPPCKLSYSKVLTLFVEWLFYWTVFWLKIIIKIPLIPYFLVKKIIKKKQA
jgi:hypothetical protein